MVSYELAPQPEFSAIQVDDGTIYHQRGEYILNDGAIHIPVNRSYRPALYGTSYPTVGRDSFVYDKLINDSVSDNDELYPMERRLSIFGKSLLLITLGSEFKPRHVFSSRFLENPHISMPARNILEQLTEDLCQQGYEVPLGVHGSHEVGLNGVDSDMDLVAWSSDENRLDYLRAIRNALLRKGFVDANETSKFNEYAVRIAHLTGLPNKVGAYLASKRNRWLSPNGTGTSLQLLSSEYRHVSAKELVESAFNDSIEGVGRVVNYPLHIEAGSCPFNYPRIWNGTADSEEFKVISFNMVHQGMGAHNSKDGSSTGRQVMTAAKFRTSNGSVVYCLQEHSDYILPEELVV